MSLKPGLYIVATPIGNLGDITFRAIETLKSVDIIAAEDTRRATILNQHFGISTPVRSVHAHNESKSIDWLIAELNDGKSVALISDAGTPLLSDPGLLMVQATQQANFPVIPLPGPSAVITALSAAGLATDTFTFFGFLSSKSAARKKALQFISEREETSVLYEAPHRVVALLKDVCDLMGSDRFIVVARELTKRFESFIRGTAQEVYEHFLNAEDQVRGEFVVLISGVQQQQSDDISQAKKTVSLLIEEGLSSSHAVKLAAKIHHVSKNDLYALINLG